MRILFAGTPQFAVPALRCLAERWKPAAVLTAPPRPRGRGRKPAESPVAVAATGLDIPVLTPERLNGDARAAVAAHEPELLVCVAYGKIFGPKFLELFPRGAINLHPSLLPEHRGPAPIPATILAGDQYAGVTVQQLALEMDAGDILLQESRALDGTETTAELTDWAAERGGRMLVEAVDQLSGGVASPRPQDHDRATYCSLIDSDDGEIDWSEDALSIDRKVRAYNPWPKAFTWLNGRRLAILEAHAIEKPFGSSGEVADRSQPPGTVLGVDSRNGILVQTGTNVLALKRIQPQARKVMLWRDFLNGVGVIEGQRLQRPGFD